MVRQVEPRPPHEISAGYFENRPWLDRLNPLTPTNSKRFVPSPEAELIIDQFSKKNKKNVHVLPFPDNRPELGPISEDTLGFYVSGDYLGGSIDPISRKVYLNEMTGPGLWTLAHELGHAEDISLRNNPLNRLAGIFGFNRQNNNLAPSISPENWRAEAHQDYHPRHLQTFKDEIEAQAYARDAYKQHGLSDETSRSDLFSYPASYISKFHDSLEAPYDARMEFKTGLEHGTGENFDFTAENNKRLLDMQFEVAADENYQKNKRDLIKEALEYAEGFNMRPPSNVSSNVLQHWYDK